MEKNYKIIPFDIEKAKAGAEVITKDGRSVRIICYNKKLDSEFTNNPIVALILYSGRNNIPYEGMMCYTLKGRVCDNEDNDDDLFLKIPVRARRMTNQELAWWLRDCPEEHREWKFENSILNLVKSTYEYQEKSANEEVEKFVLIRKNGGEWEEPLIEIND